MGVSLHMIRRVVLTREAQKDIRKVPRHVAAKLAGWIEDVEEKGLEEVRKVPGFHDEPLKGARAGQRSLRLSKGYRAIYRIAAEGTVEFVSVEEVNKHAY